MEPRPSTGCSAKIGAADRVVPDLVSRNLSVRPVASQLEHQWQIRQQFGKKYSRDVVAAHHPQSIWRVPRQFARDWKVDCHQSGRAGPRFPAATRIVGMSKPRKAGLQRAQATENGVREIPDLEVSAVTLAKAEDPARLEAPVPLTRRSRENSSLVEVPIATCLQSCSEKIPDRSNH